MMAVERPRTAVRATARQLTVYARSVTVQRSEERAERKWHPTPGVGMGWSRFGR